MHNFTLAGEEAEPDWSAQSRMYYGDSETDWDSFYRSLSSVEELIRFLRCRPRPALRVAQWSPGLHSKIVAVAPTADLKGVHARSFRQSFREWSVILVESAGPTFNFSYSMNVGLSIAKEMDANWIMVSNDDVWFGGKMPQLEAALSAFENVDIVVPYVLSGSRLLNRETLILKQPRLASLLYERLLPTFVRAFPVGYRGEILASQYPNLQSGSVTKYLTLQSSNALSRLGFPAAVRTRGPPYAKSLGITTLSRHLCVQPVAFVRAEAWHRLAFDETFSNGGEDTDLSIVASREGLRTHRLNATFFAHPGASLGVSMRRIYQNTVPERLYLGYKFKTGVWSGFQGTRPELSPTRSP